MAVTAMKEWREVFGSAFDAMERTGPKGNLLQRLEQEAKQTGVVGSASEMLRAALADKHEPIRELLLQRLSSWDFSLTASWSRTEPNTRARRDEIYERLSLKDALRELFESELPPRLNEEREIVVSEGSGDRWYSADFLRGREFYWPRFADYLRKTKKLPENVCQSLNETSNRILEHLAEPHSGEPTPRRGLVVGYVQSGKTTNFTAVIAKAIDAGFRFIIVLAGTIDLLRKQTQRRLDMELVGLENINVDQEDENREYRDDKSWKSFLSFGEEPRKLGFPNIRRLTSSTGDFRSVSNSLKIISFDEVDPQLGPACSPQNIKRMNARLVVIKKNTSRLKYLIREIKAAKRIHNDLPTLVIDDESDQASVNTRAKFRIDKQRTKTNAAIVELLKSLPRAQYVGYTATPFANVFVDPDDSEDIFPRDFILSLPRPTGYMGVRDFHDLEEVAPGAMGNREAHVRQFKEADADEQLNRALDSYLVAGALKLHRSSKGVPGDFRHHTMMIHETVRNEAQSDRKSNISDLWLSAGYASPGKGRTRLEVALEEFRRVSTARDRDMVFPKSFSELRPFVAESLKRIESDGGPVLVVNGTEDSDDPEFDSKDVWKVLVGGAKLSRGFTVEGLTVTYFRRRATQQDSLLQMGRWFGYRGGYADLVRLFLESGDEGGFDLYDAFEAICRDEESFRAQLSQYSHSLKPREVPALVYNSYPKLMPTARNKMFNAELVSAGFQGWVESGYRSRVKGLVENWEALERLVKKGLTTASLPTRFLSVEVDRKAVVNFLDRFVWSDEYSMVAEREFLRKEPSVVDSWYVLLPQLEKGGIVSLGGEVECSVHTRTAKGDYFKVFSDKRRNEAEEFARKSRAGILLVYPTQPRGEVPLERPVVGFAVFHPTEAAEARLKFRARKKEEPMAISVPVRRAK